VLSRIVKWTGGVAQARTVPRFARQTFVDWFATHESAVATHIAARHDGSPVITHADSPRFAKETYTTDSMQRSSNRNELHPHGRLAPFDTDRVLLWPDTFNNYLESAVGPAAVKVLEHAGYRVEIPPRPLCCGRPLYDWGMLTTAERLWRQVLDTLRPWIRAGVPVVGLEPSCVAAFRDELVNLFPHDDDARRLSEQTLLLSEFLERQRYQPAPLPTRMDAEVALLKRMGVDFDQLDSGCCGMAGSFGFGADHYEVSQRIGERVLLPAVRAADDGTVIVTDGFSCREQIEQATDRRAAHIAELLALAIDDAG
jgi:Fe-S oxidoreductase